jgi:hypothetical protein
MKKPHTLSSMKNKRQEARKDGKVKYYDAGQKLMKGEGK